jgi:hypothetical protein
MMGSEIDVLRRQLKEEEKAVYELIGQRDYWEAKATKLANDIGEALGFDVGEHSSNNCPVEAALDQLYWIRTQEMTVSLTPPTEAPK